MLSNLYSKVIKNISSTLVIITTIFGLCNTSFASSLDKIIVTANRTSENVKEVTSATIIIEEEEIKRSSATNLGEFLEELNIGHIQKYPGQSSSIAVRGFRTETHGNDLRGKVLILIDGRRAGTGNTAMIMTKNIERIEIIKGAAGVQYGSAAIGGVVNVITKRGKGKPSLFIEGSLGSFSYNDISLGSSGELFGMDYSFAYSHEASDDYKTSKGKYDNSEYKSQNLSLNLGYSFLKTHRIGIIFTQNDGTDIGSPNKQEFQTLDNKLDSIDKSLSSYDIQYEGSSNDFNWNMRYYAGKEKRKYINYYNEEESGENEYSTDFKGAQVNVTYDKKMIAITTGADYSQYNLENRNKTTSTETKPYNMDNQYENQALFIIPKLRLLNETLILTVGARYDSFKVKIEDTPLWTNMKSQNETTTNTIYNAGIAYNVTQKVKLRAQYGQGFRVPSANELAADYSSLNWSTGTNIIYKGNPDLDPESTETYEAGFDTDYGWTSASMTYFQTYYRDMIQEKSESTYRTWTNIGKSEIFGFEGSFKLDFGAIFDWEWTVEPFASFTYITRAKDKETNKDLEYISDLQASYGILVSDNAGFFTRLNITHTSKQDITDWNPQTYVSEKTTLKAFNVANWNISKQVYTSETLGNVTLRGDVLNLFNEDYAYVKGYSMPQRNYKATVRYDYQF